MIHTKANSSDYLSLFFLPERWRFILFRIMDTAKIADAAKKPIKSMDRRILLKHSLTWNRNQSRC